MTGPAPDDIPAACDDPSLDPHFPRTGPCGFCGLDARHRLLDSAAGAISAGDDPEVAGQEFGISGEGVAALLAWMEKWPGAWR